MVKKRYLSDAIASLSYQMHKMAFISGPRQCGKTTLAKFMLKTRGAGAYFNWDEKGFRQLWGKRPISIVEPFLEGNGSIAPLLVLDEIHKAKLWKRNLKGVYDSLDMLIDIVVTGSAKLDVYRRGSDSLLGRYFHFRLHPFSLAELLNNEKSVNIEDLLSHIFTTNMPTITTSIIQSFDQLWHYGPFPEPLLAQDKKVLRIWQRDRVERLVREDLRDLTRIQELSQIEVLVSLLPEKAGGVLSITALREDLEVAYATMKS